MTQIQPVTSAAQILECLPVLLELRPHLQAAEFVDRVQQQMSIGYQLIILKVDTQVVASAGFHLSTNLAWGKHLYIEDLVVATAQRSNGYGDQLFQWLMDYAKQHGCEQLHLDSGVQRFAAHRFYLRQRLNISSHHFSMRIDKS
jgi:GNAT superfamily N-acetyltransferase